jgi:hypothetical protein
MSGQVARQTQQSMKVTSIAGGVLQRACACGHHTSASGECEECKKKREGTLQRTAIHSFSFPSYDTKARLPQTKLAINEPGDEYEQEADRIADQVMAIPVSHSVSKTPPRVQRFAEQPRVQTEKAPTSVDQALASPGSPLEPALRHDMEQRFGYDFSTVRVHTDATAEKSARDVDARAYAVGHNIVFGTGQFVPRTKEGQRLIAHELTHSIQQAASSTLQVSRFVEREHKNLGNLATTKFPYFAKLTTDEVALRSSPKGRRIGNEFHNLVASLRENVRLLVVGNVSKWMRVMVDSGTALDRKTNQPINASGLTGFVSQELLVQESGVFDQQLPLVPGLTLTYGDIISLGDHFARFSDLEDKANTADGINKIKKYIDVVDGRRKGDFEDPNTIDKEWAERYKNLAFENISHFSSGGTALETWKKYHYQALKSAASGGAFGNIGMLQRAYAINGFADHFLTDSFSSGHIRTPRIKILEYYQQFFDQYLDSILNYIYTEIGDQIMIQIFHDHPNITGLGGLIDHDFCADNKKAISDFKSQADQEMRNNNLQPKDLKKLLFQYIGGAVSKVLHDNDNEAGLEVKSKRHPEGWKTFGDGKLNTSFQNFILEALVVSKSEVLQAFNIGIELQQETGNIKLRDKIEPLVYPVSKIEDYIPEANTIKNRPLPEWRISTDIWETMDKSVQDKLTVLVKKYLDDKTLDTLIAKIPNSVEVEIDWSPNVNARPRDATRVVLVRFRDDPVNFITWGAKAPKDFGKALDKAGFCNL